VKDQPLLWWAVARYARLHGRARAAGVRLRGLGWLLRRVRTDRVLEVEDVQLWFDHRVAACYDLLVAGELNEPETAVFLRAVLDALEEPVTFVDVGSNVGELLITLAAHPRVGHAVGFEPQPCCVEACERSAELNGFRHVRLHCALVADGSVQRFAVNPRAPNVSAIARTGESVATVRLDDALADAAAPTVLLVDVEGAEPLVLRGAARLIGRVRPLIVFEYNSVSRAHYRLEDARDALGRSYTIYRLRRDGRLDSNVEESWNCVAVPAGGAFEAACAELTLR
jgi:FkbM family methyltransferase